MKIKYDLACPFLSDRILPKWLYQLLNEQEWIYLLIKSFEIYIAPTLSCYNQKGGQVEMGKWSEEASLKINENK